MMRSTVYNRLANKIAYYTLRRGGIAPKRWCVSRTKMAALQAELITDPSLIDEPIHGPVDRPTVVIIGIPVIPR